MSDDVLRAAERAWRAHPTPENAQRWATAYSRVHGRPEGETPLIEDLLEPYGDRVAAVLADACAVYLGKPLEECLVEQLYWITEAHFWAMPGKPSPRVLRSLAEFYEDHGMELKEGNEDQAVIDYSEARLRYNATAQFTEENAALRERCERLEKELRQTKTDWAYSVDAQTLKAAQAQIANLQVMIAAKTEENERLAQALQGRAQPRR